jgi:CheY-like chemotaxis protein
MRPVKRPLTILQVDDSPSDVALTGYALRMSSVPHALHVVPDGRQAMQFLRREDGHAGAPRPDLILLDLGLPGEDGHQVLRQIKNDPVLKTIPVVMFSSFDSKMAQRLAYELHASAYVVKPDALSAFWAAVQAIEEQWSRQPRQIRIPNGRASSSGNYVRGRSR